MEKNQGHFGDNFVDYVFKAGVGLTTGAAIVGIGTLIYYTIHWRSIRNVLNYLNSRRAQVQVKYNIMKTYIFFIVSFIICIQTAAVVTTQKPLHRFFSSFSMLVFNCAVEFYIHACEAFCTIDTGFFSHQTLVWVAYSIFLGGATSHTLLEEPATLRLGFLMTTFLVLGLVLLSLVSPATKFFKMQQYLCILEIIVFLSSFISATIPLIPFLGAIIFILGFHGGLIVFPLLFLYHIQEAYLLATQASARKPYCPLRMSLRLLVDVLNFFSRITYLIPSSYGDYLK